MGRKRWKNRKHFLFYSACILIIFLMTEGCLIPARRVEVLPAGGTPIERASRLTSKGNYQGALKTLSKIARSYPRESPGDRALFEMGLIWAYPSNPKRNYEEALKYFRKLLRDFPRSPLREEAGAWADLISKIARYESRIKDQDSEIISYKKEIKQFKEQISEFKGQISTLKEIDIGIEKKKRKGLPEE